MEMLGILPAVMVIRIPIKLKMETHNNLLNNNHPHPSINKDIQTPVNNLGNPIPSLKLDPQIHLLNLGQLRSGPVLLKTLIDILGKDGTQGDNTTYWPFW